MHRLVEYCALIKTAKPPSAFSPRGLYGVTNFYSKKERIQLMLVPPRTQGKTEDFSHLLIYVILKNVSLSGN